MALLLRPRSRRRRCRRRTPPAASRGGEAGRRPGGCRAGRRGAAGGPAAAAAAEAAGGGGGRGAAARRVGRPSSPPASAGRGPDRPLPGRADQPRRPARLLRPPRAHPRPTAAPLDLVRGREAAPIPSPWSAPSWRGFPSTTPCSRSTTAPSGAPAPSPSATAARPARPRRPSSSAPTACSTSTWRWSAPRLGALARPRDPQSDPEELENRFERRGGLQAGRRVRAAGRQEGRGADVPPRHGAALGRPRGPLLPHRHHPPLAGARGAVRAPPGGPRPATTWLASPRCRPRTPSARSRRSSNGTSR